MGLTYHNNIYKVLNKTFLSWNVCFLMISSKTQKGKVSANYTKLAKSINEPLKISENLIIFLIKISQKSWRNFSIIFNGDVTVVLNLKTFLKLLTYIDSKFTKWWINLTHLPTHTRIQPPLPPSPQTPILCVNSTQKDFPWFKRYFRVKS